MAAATASPLKRRLACAWLALFAIWPLLHHALVRGYDVDPWKFAGWSMYARVTLPPVVKLYEFRAPAHLERLDPGRLPPRSRAAYERFARGRRVYGTLASPDELGSLYLEERPEAERLEVTVVRWTLDADARAHERVWHHVYERD